MSDETKTTGRATSEELDALHGMTARAIRKAIARYENGEVLDKNGNAKAVPASLIAQATQFLKINSVDRPQLPNVDDDQEAELNDVFDMIQGTGTHGQPLGGKHDER